MVVMASGRVFTSSCYFVISCLFLQYLAINRSRSGSYPWPGIPGVLVRDSYPSLERFCQVSLLLTGPRGGGHLVNRPWRVRYLFRRIVYHSNGTSTFNPSLLRSSSLLLCGDISSNPGPTKFPCGLCTKPVKVNQRGIQCDYCDFWFHVKCLNMDPIIYEALANSSCIWECDQCGFPNFSSSLMTSLTEIQSTNMFSPLDSPTQNSRLSPETPSMASTPIPNKPFTATKKSKFQPRNTSKLTICSINFCGIRNKVAELHAFIEYHVPDIIIGTETHLSPDIKDCELLSNLYTIIRKDRRNSRGGGVLIAVKSDLVVTNHSDSSDCEIIWVEVQGKKKSNSIFIGSFYRPPASDISVLLELEKSIENISNIAKNHTVIIGGDFNLPGVNWNTYSVNPGSRDVQDCQCLLDIAQDFHLSQLVTEPTRTTNTTANILDLILTSKPSLVENVHVTPGLSDHDIVIASVLHRAPRNNCKPRVILDFKRGNAENFLKDLKYDCDSFVNSNPHQNTVEFNWLHFKQILMGNATKHFPPKLLKPSKTTPWFNRKLKRMIKKKQRLYNLAKQTNTLLNHGIISSPLDARPKLLLITQEITISHQYYQTTSRKTQSAFGNTSNHSGKITLEFLP